MSSKILSIAMMGKNRIGLISDLTKYIYILMVLIFTNHEWLVIVVVLLYL